MARVSGRTYFAISSLRSARMSRSGRGFVPRADSSTERHFIMMDRARQSTGEGFSRASHTVYQFVGLPATEVAGYFQSSFQDEPRFTTNYELPFAHAFYIPGSFIPARRRAKLGLPICLNIFFIWAY